MVDIINRKSIISHILLVETESAHVFLSCCTAIRCSLSHIRITQLVVTGIVDMQTVTRRQGQSLNRSDLRIPIGIDNIHQVFGLIVNQVTGRVSDRHERTALVRTLSVTIVIYLTSVIGHDITIGITHIQRINRCRKVSDIESVTRRIGSSLFARITAIGKVISHISPHFQPIVYLVITVQTTAVTLESRTVNYTLVIQIAQREVERSTVITA